MELQLDGVEEGKENWVKTLRRFWVRSKSASAKPKKKMPEVKRKGLRNRASNANSTAVTW